MQQKQQAAEVREVQHWLRRIAQQDDRIPLIGVDGIYGEQTQAAVRAFQQAYRLPVTGTVDRLTWQALQEVDRAVRDYHHCSDGPHLLHDESESLGPDTADDRVWILQAMLHTLHRRGDIAQDVPLNGRYDAGTEQAVRQVQRLGRLPQTGCADRATVDLLASLYNGAAPR